ncbi:MAG: Fe-S protein assembly co-chaperone HscB [Zoogloeaceae bacterium]|jgi:molecular chaperone HscB|nr:Fe-S protein assembly co-chaperone HscB [Zoogloeaceae bacterium]
MDLTCDFFTLFRLAPRFRLDVAALAARYLELQNSVHPDRFAQAGQAERRLSMQWAARVNEAYRTLKEPLARAQYLLRLAGRDPEAASGALAEDTDFLMQQMEWREEVRQARQERSMAALRELRQRLAREVQAQYEALAARFDDEHDLAAAVGQTRRLMFQEKLRAEIDDALAFLEDAEDAENAGA